MNIFGQEANLKRLEIAIKNDYPVLLIGETGTGKTSMIRELGKKMKADVTRFNLTGETGVDEFVGKYELVAGETVWKDGVLLNAMKKGQWLVVDEVNAALPEILFVLHSLLDDDKFVLVSNHEGEIVKPHKNFRFFATMNPVDEYAGTKELNKAFKSRFEMVLYVDYAENKHEVQAVMAQAGIKESEVLKMVALANNLRDLKAAHKIFYTCSTRDLIHWAKISKELDMEEAFMVCIVNKANGDGPIIKEEYKKIFGGFKKLESKGKRFTIEGFEQAVVAFEAMEKKRTQEIEEELKKGREENEKIKADLEKKKKDLYAEIGKKIAEDYGK